MHGIHHLTVYPYCHTFPSFFSVFSIFFLFLLFLHFFFHFRAPIIGTESILFDLIIPPLCSPLLSSDLYSHFSSPPLLSNTLLTCPLPSHLSFPCALLSYLLSVSLFIPFFIILIFLYLTPLFHFMLSCLPLSYPMFRSSSDVPCAILRGPALVPHTR